jgi:hypothetical protein
VIFLAENLRLQPNLRFFEGSRKLENTIRELRITVQKLCSDMVMGLDKKTEQRLLQLLFGDVKGQK